MLQTFVPPVAAELVPSTTNCDVGTVEDPEPEIAKPKTFVIADIFLFFSKFDTLLLFSRSGFHLPGPVTLWTCDQWPRIDRQAFSLLVHYTVSSADCTRYRSVKGLSQIGNRREPVIIQTHFLTTL